MSEKPKVDPALVNGPPPGTRLRPPEVAAPPPKPRRPAGAKGKRSAEAQVTAPASPPEPSSAAIADQGAVAPIAVTGELLPPPAAALGAPRPKSRKELEMERIARIDSQIRKDASRVVLHSLAGSEIDDDSQRPAGWSDKKWRAARDARMNRREGPAYIDHASKIYESFLRADALSKREGRVAPALNAQISFYVRGDIKNTYNYPVIDVKDEP